MWLLGVLIISFGCAMLSHYMLQMPLLTFGSSAIALILLSKFLGQATEQLAGSMGERKAGFLNVTLSNISEVIIIFAAVRANMIELVHGGIIGSIIGNLLLITGCSIFLGCKKNGPLKFEPGTITMLINQFFLVGVLLFLPSLFGDQIPEGHHRIMSYFFSIMLIGVYLYASINSLKDKRYQVINEQAQQMEKHWTKGFSISVLVVTIIGAFFMSEFLVKEVGHVATSLEISQVFIGFVVLPFLGNMAEHVVAITAARKGMAELSLSIAVGSATQVGMVVAPLAVLFGLITGNYFILSFTGMPLGLLVISLIAIFLVLRDNQWNKSEGIMLIALYSAIIMGLAFTQ